MMPRGMGSVCSSNFTAPQIAARFRGYENSTSPHYAVRARARALGTRTTVRLAGATWDTPGAHCTQVGQAAARSESYCNRFFPPMQAGAFSLASFR